MNGLPPKNERGMEGKPEFEKPVPSDDEDDCEGYFLEPVANTVDIAEKIAEANRKLLEEAEEDDGREESRPRKVQFSEELVNFEPNYYSDDDCTQSAQNSVNSEEDTELKSLHEDADEGKIEDISAVVVEEVNEATQEDDIPEEIPEEVDGKKQTVEETSERNAKFILVLLPKEQNSSCESIIGEEIPEEGKNREEKRIEAVKPVKTKMARPKSAKKSCDVTTISPNLNFSSRMERKSWKSSQSPLVKSKTKMEERKEKKNVFFGEINVRIKGRFLKKVNLYDMNLEDVPDTSTLKRCEARPRSCISGRENGGGENRPSTAPMRRTCCVLKTELPRYNGLRSEYGLSAEQLQERKQKSLEIKLKRKQEQVRKRQEEVKRRNENEETFQKWLFNKTKKSFRKKSLKLRDTLTRSDVYIQTHASYAVNRSVPYCLDYNITKKVNDRKRDPRGKKNKMIAVEKLLNNTSLNFKRSFNIYLGFKP